MPTSVWCVQPSIAWNGFILVLRNISALPLSGLVTEHLSLTGLRLEAQAGVIPKGLAGVRHRVFV